MQEVAGCWVSKSSSSERAAFAPNHKPSLQPQVIMSLLYTLFHAMSLNSISPKVSFCKEMIFLRRLRVVLKSN